MRAVVVTLAAGALTIALSGCAVVSVVDTAASVAGTVITTTVDVAGSVVKGAAHTISGGSHDKDQDKDQDKDKEKSDSDKSE